MKKIVFFIGIVAMIFCFGSCENPEYGAVIVRQNDSTFISIDTSAVVKNDTICI